MKKKCRYSADIKELVHISAQLISYFGKCKYIDQLINHINLLSAILNKLKLTTVPEIVRFTGVSWVDDGVLLPYQVKCLKKRGLWNENGKLEEGLYSPEHLHLMNKYCKQRKNRAKT